MMGWRDGGRDYAMPLPDDAPQAQDAREAVRDRLRAGGALVTARARLHDCLDFVHAYTEPLLDAGYQIEVKIQRTAGGRTQCEITAHPLSPWPDDRSSPLP
jgi:hypothetical protein